MLGIFKLKYFSERLQIQDTIFKQSCTFTVLANEGAKLIHNLIDLTNNHFRNSLYLWVRHFNTDHALIFFFDYLSFRLSEDWAIYAVMQIPFSDQNISIKRYGIVYKKRQRVC